MRYEVHPSRISPTEFGKTGWAVIDTEALGCLALTALFDQDDMDEAVHVTSRLNQHGDTYKYATRHLGA